MKVTFYWEGRPYVDYTASEIAEKQVTLTNQDNAEDVLLLEYQGIAD